MKTAAYFSFLFCIVLCSYSCKKSTSYYYIRQGLKDYGQFAQGSSWIYKNDSTGGYDTVRADSKVYEGMFYEQDFGFTAELIMTHLNSSFLSEYKMSFECSPPLTKSMDGFSDKLEICIRVNDSTIRSYLSIWPDQQTGREDPSPCLCPDGKCYLFKTEVLDSLTVNGNKFSNVLHSYLRSVNTTQTGIPILRRDYYFVKKIGLVKLHEFDQLYGLNRSFSIVNWNILQ